MLKAQTNKPILISMFLKQKSEMLDHPFDAVPEHLINGTIEKLGTP